MASIEQNNINSTKLIISECTNLLEILANQKNSYKGEALNIVFKIQREIELITNSFLIDNENVDVPKSHSGQTSSNQYIYTDPLMPTYIKNAINDDLKKQEEKLLEKSRAEASSKLNSRQLPDGGMAPPKFWESKLSSSVKHNLVEELRKLKATGNVVTKSNFHHKKSSTIEEFTEPFRYIENLNDYNGPFLVNLLKSEAEINNQAAVCQVDLTIEKQKCLNEESIILSVYDIAGSVSKEEKKFLIILDFDKLYGIIRYRYVLFTGGKALSLSQRQHNEIQNFFKSKKINY